MITIIVLATTSIWSFIVLATTSIWSCSYHFFFMLRIFEIYCLRAFMYMIQYYWYYYNMTVLLFSRLVVSDSFAMDCGSLGSSVLGFSQARILEWVAISFSRGSSRPGDWTHISCISEFLQISSELSWSIPTLKWGSTRVIRKLYVFELDCLSWCLGHRRIFRVDFFVCLSVRVFFFDWPVSSERKAWLLVFSRKGQKTLSIMTTFT